MSTYSNRDAEVLVLAAGLASKVTRDRVRSILTARDFEQPAHEAIWDAYSAIDNAGESVTSATLVNAVKGNRGAVALLPELARPFSTSEATSAAKVVRDLAVRRTAKTLLVRATQQIESPDVTPTGFLSTLINDAAAIRDANTADDDLTALTLRELLDQPDEPYNWLIPGLLERGDRLMLTGVEGMGKALAIDTPIPTPSGWTTMADLSIGDEVFSPDGKPVRIGAATEVMHDHPCYRVTFSDGSEIVADEQHLWLTRSLRCRELDSKATRREVDTKPRGTDQRHKRQHHPEVLTTAAIRDSLWARDGHALNHSVDASKPLEYPERDLLVDPYTLGAWLGDGTSRSAQITTHTDDTEILDRIAASGWPVRKLNGPYLWGIGDGGGKGLRGRATFAGCLREIGVLGNKHIPHEYLTASADQRLALLQGLMDTDGTIGTGVSPRCEFSVVSERLAEDVHDLLLSLGIVVKLAAGPATIDGRVVGTRYRLSFVTELPVFHLTRKAERQTPLRTMRGRIRYITAVEPVQSVPVRCIQVENADGMFVAGRECIPTHNSVLLRQLAVSYAGGLHPFKLRQIEPGNVLIVDAENTERQVRRSMRGLATAVAQRSTRDPRDHVIIECTGRMDITDDMTLSKIHRIADAQQPDIIVIGPLYRITRGALQNDDDAAPVLAALDTLKDRGIALLIEAHAGHSQKSQGVRDLRPRGSSSLLGWPEFGYGLKPGDAEREFRMEKWRGDRDVRDWPSTLERGGQMPWMPGEEEAVQWAVNGSPWERNAS